MTRPPQWRPIIAEGPFTRLRELRHFRLGLHTRPEEVVRALSEQGIQVNPELVRQVQFEMLKRSTAVGRQRTIPPRATGLPAPVPEGVSESQPRMRTGKLAPRCALHSPTVAEVVPLGDTSMVGPVELSPGEFVYFIPQGGTPELHKHFLKVAATTGNSDPVATILKVKGWASEVGGIKKLKALVDALSVQPPF